MQKSNHRLTTQFFENNRLNEIYIMTKFIVMVQQA
jgi:hypothetical protein